MELLSLFSSGFIPCDNGLSSIIKVEDLCLFAFVSLCFKIVIIWSIALFFAVVISFERFNFSFLTNSPFVLTTHLTKKTIIVKSLI